MAIYEIILCILILLVSVLVCAVTLSMDKADKNSLSVITGISDTMRSNAKDSTKTSANKIRVARKSRAALVRAVAIRSRANGQDLPHALSGQHQKIHKISGSLAHGANAIPARQAGNRHQDTAATLLHFFSSP